MGRSSQVQLIKKWNYIINNTDGKNNTHVVYQDYSRAFDVVDQNIALKKLKENFNGSSFRFNNILQRSSDSFWRLFLHKTAATSCTNGKKDPKLLNMKLF